VPRIQCKAAPYVQQMYFWGTDGVRHGVWLWSSVAAIPFVPVSRFASKGALCSIHSHPPQACDSAKSIWSLTTLCRTQTISTAACYLMCPSHTGLPPGSWIGRAAEVLQPHVAHKCDPLEPCGRKRVFKAEQESGAQKAAGAHIKLFFLGGHVPFLH
jgi:hypothetical protein